MNIKKAIYLSLSIFAVHLSASDKIFLATDFWKSMDFNQMYTSDKELLYSPLFSKIQATYEAFSEQMMNRDPIDYSQPPTTSTIPATIHFIWLGSELPNEAKASIDSWKEQHPGWTIRIWKDEDLENFAWTTERIKKNFYEATHFAEKSCLLRYEILYQFGGVYSDTDVICLKPFHDLILSGFDFFGGIEVNWVSRITKNPLHAGVAIMGAIRGCKTMKYCIDHHIGINEAPEENYLNRVSPGLCSQAIDYTIHNGEEPILLLPASYFYSFPFRYRHLSVTKALEYKAPESMAIHLWRASWLPQEELERIKQKALISL